MSLADRYAEPLLVYCSADECRLTRPKLKADASGALWCDEHFPTAAPSLPAAAGEPTHPDYESLMRSWLQLRDACATLRSTLDAREQRIAELTRDVEEVGNARDLYHTRTVNLLGQVERLSSEVARIGELEKEVEAFRAERDARKVGGISFAVDPNVASGSAEFRDTQTGEVLVRINNLAASPPAKAAVPPPSPVISAPGETR